MVSYRFCRTDDWGLLADASNLCWLPAFEGATEIDERGLKVLVREIQLWASSCMVATEGEEILAVMFGCRREHSTLIERIAVIPSERRRGHAAHLLDSLSSKLAILGPPRLEVEILAESEDHLAFFESCGYRKAGELVDWQLESLSSGSSSVEGAMPVPFAVDDLEANGLEPAIEAVAWSRGLPALKGRARSIEGLALASFDGILAHVLIDTERNEIVALGVAAELAAQAALRPLLSELGSVAPKIPKLDESELPSAVLEALGFERQRRWIRLLTEATPA